MAPAERLALRQQVLALVSLALMNTQLNTIASQAPSLCIDTSP